MSRGSRILIVTALLAATAYVTWRLVEGPGGGRAGTSQPAPEAQPADGRTATRPVPMARSAESRPESIPSADDRIEGTVYDEQRHPVSGAEVQIVRREFNGASTRPVDRRFEERIMATTTSEPDGRYSFAGLVPGELKTVRALRSGFVPVFTDSVRVPKTHDIYLATGTPVTGRVVDAATKEPIQDVGVKGWHDSAGGSSVYKWMEEVFTNRLGDFAFESVPQGKVTFMLAQPDYLDLMVDRQVAGGGTNDLRLEMERGLTIEGSVVDARDGGPVPNVRVGAKDINPLAARWTARTDSSGRFRMVGVRPGAIHFEISGRGINPFRQTRQVTAAEDFSGPKQGRRLEFRVEPAGRATGRVTTRGGEPVVSARIFVAPVQEYFRIVRDPTENGGTLQDGEVRTDSNGGFLVDSLTTTSQLLVAEAPGFAIGTSEPFSVNPGEIRENVSLVLEPAPVIRGKVTSESGTMVAGAAIAIDVPLFERVSFRPGFDLGQKARREVTTDASGGYRIEIPYPAKVLVQVDHPDFVLKPAVEVPIADAQLEVVRDFTLKPALAISGTVMGETGLGESDAVVRAWGLHSAIPFETKSGAGGAYSVRRIEAGTYRLTASKPGSGLASEFKDGVPAGSTGVDLRLARPGSVAGLVTTPGGSPVTKFHVAARPVRERSRSRDEQKLSIAGVSGRDLDVDDPEGRFRLENLEAVRWGIVIICTEFTPSLPVEVDVTGGAEASAGTIVVNEGSSVHGKIALPGGVPAEGVTVTLTRLRDLPNQDPARVPPTPPRTGASGPTGDYEVRGLVPGEYFLKLQSQRFMEPSPQTFAVPEGASLEKSFVVKLAASVELVLKDEVGEPVSSALINVLDEQKHQLPLQADGTASVHTDTKGTLAIKKLPAGERLTIRALRVGFIVTETPQELREGDNGTLQIRLERLH